MRGARCRRQQDRAERRLVARTSAPLVSGAALCVVAGARGPPAAAAAAARECECRNNRPSAGEEVCTGHDGRVRGIRRRTLRTSRGHPPALSLDFPQRCPSTTTSTTTSRPTTASSAAALDPETARPPRGRAARSPAVRRPGAEVQGAAGRPSSTTRCAREIARMGELMADSLGIGLAANQVGRAAPPARLPRRGGQPGPGAGQPGDRVVLQGRGDGSRRAA